MTEPTTEDVSIVHIAYRIVVYLDGEYRQVYQQSMETKVIAANLADLMGLLEHVHQVVQPLRLGDMATAPIADVVGEVLNMRNMLADDRQSFKDDWVPTFAMYLKEEGP